MNYVITPSSVIVTTYEGETYTVASDHDRYVDLKCAIIDEDWDEVTEIVTAKNKLQELIGEFGKVSVYGGHVTYDGIDISNHLATKILQATNKEPFARFLENVMENPSRRAAQDLFKWAEKACLPITTDGHLIAYKYVRNDYKDCHSGTFDNSVGAICEMPRNQVCDDPDVSCAEGLHFCSLDYLNNSGDSRRLMIIKINPRDVVAFPDQYQMTKARCCRYEVIHEIKWAEAAGYFMDSDGVFIPPQEQLATDGFYLIQASTGEYWKAFGKGTTPNRDEAHIFTEDETRPFISDGIRRLPVNAPDERTILQRIERLEQHIGLLATSTITGRLDAIDKALGLDPVEPLTARLDRAEAQLALS